MEVTKLMHFNQNQDTSYSQQEHSSVGVDREKQVPRTIISWTQMPLYRLPQERFTGIAITWRAFAGESTSEGISNPGEQQTILGLPFRLICGLAQ